MKKYLLLFLICVYASIGAWAGEVSYPFTFGDGNLSKVEKVDFGNNQYGLVVTIGKTGDFAIFANMLGNSGDSYINSNYLNWGRLRIVCTNGAVINATDVATYKSKMSNAPITSLDLTDASFDDNASINSLIAQGVSYLSLPKNKSIENITIPTVGNPQIKGIVTSDGNTATYIALNGESSSSDFATLLKFYTENAPSSLTGLTTWTITNGAASGSITAGAETGNILTAIVSNSTATTLNITLDGITNSPTTLAPSSSITNLTISGIQYPNQYESLTINGGSALTTLTLEDTTIPGSLTIGGCPELVTADLRGVRKKPNGGSTKLDVTVNDDPKLSNLILYKSSTETGCNVSGTTRPVGSGLTVTYALPAIPIEYDDCKVTINLSARNGATMSDLISDAETELAKSNTNICTLIVTGALTTTDLQSLDDAETATRIDLSEATLATGASVDNIQVPTTLLSLVLPPNNTVSSTLETELAKATGFEYVYSETSDNGATVPTYVWIAKTGVMAHVFQNESSLTSAVYLKVAAKSGVSLDQNSVDLSNTNMNSLQFLDVSESGLTTAAAPYYKAPHWNPYRIILPNNWSGDDMAIFAANKNIGAIAAVYSYHGTTLKILEIIDASYSQAALADSRIMRSGTTEVDVVSGYYDGTTYAQFGTNLLAALNNMGKSEFSVTTKDANNNDVVTNYTNTVGQSVKTISIETTSAAPNTLTFDNPSITTLKAENLVQNNAELNVDACTALTTLDLSGSSIKSIDASRAALVSVDLSGTAIANAADFSGAALTTAFTTSNETTFNGALNLSNTGLTAFSTAARIVGDISFNQCSSLASINVTAADFANTTSKIHIDADPENESNTTIISTLTANECIQIPSSFDKSRLHPTPADALVKQASAVAAAYTFAESDMVFHDNNTSDAYYPTYRYWYQGSMTNDQIVTLGTSSERTLDNVLTNNSTALNFTTKTYVKAKVVGPLVESDMDDLALINATVLDLSDVTSGENNKTIGELLKTYFSSNALNTNTKFVVLPDTCSREHILNATALDGLKNSVYCVLAAEPTSEGRDLTSYSFVSGALQPAVVAALSSSAQSWTLTPEGQNQRNIYTSSVSNFKKLKISGLINSYDLSKADQKLDADGHLSWAEDVVESTAQTRTLNGDYNVYGPFSSCFLLTEIDLRDAYFEPKSTGEDTSVYFRYWYSDMTLSFLNVISTATYKVVIPQNSKVREIPADFMRCSTNIRAICIPSNIQAIRTRAFYTIDYVWTTADAYATSSTTSDPEGKNTRLDNGAKLSDGTPVKALNYEGGKYKENPAFLDSYYTADYSGDKGGGTYTFGSTLKLIETGAFANTQPHVKDVYVLNTTAPECHVDAFNTVMYTGNGGYSSISSGQQIISRTNYFNNGFWITMLHYPRQTTTPNVQRYTDPTREYSIATGERDGKGAPIYFPNQSEFIRAYQQGTYGYVWNAWNPTREYGSVNNGTLTNTTSGWIAENQTAANALFNNYATGDNHQYTSFYKVSDFTEGTVTAPTATIVPYYQVQYGSGSYSTAETQGNLYPRSEIDANSDADTSGEKTTKDYRGWHQFVLNAYAANTILDEEPYRSYITDDEWWTICPTFDITREECAILFGQAQDIHISSPSQYPYVSKLRYVRRFYGDGKGTITLNFTENLAEKKENRYQKTDKHGINNSSGYVTILNDAPDADDVVMSAGVPYLIKPNMGASPKRQFRIFKTQSDLQSFRDQFTNEEWENRNFVAFAHASLYDKIKAAQAENGATQIQHIHDGMYTVPVFVSESDGSGLLKENVETVSGTRTPYHPTGSTSTYYKSTDWVYTFVGTFYKSFLPHYCYYLGWDSSLGAARFFYLDGEKGKPGVFTYYDNNMNWNNETGVICPTFNNNGYINAESRVFGHEVTPAHDKTPAQWNIDDLVSDSFTVSSGSQGAKTYEMVFGAPDMIADNSEVTGISNIDANDSLDANSNADVYTINGQKVGTSLEGLPKGIYIVNGKKFIVK